MYAAVVEHKDEDQATGMEIAEPFITCGQKACKTHKKIIAAFIQNDDKVEVARGRFTDMGSDIDIWHVISAGEEEAMAGAKSYLSKSLGDGPFEVGSSGQGKPSTQPHYNIQMR
jgi:hypothetical protein